MSEKNKQDLAYWIDLTWKVSTPLLFIGGFYLQATFATKADMETMNKAISERLTKTETAILLLTKENEVNQRQDAMMLDHEQRLRAMEHKRAREE